MIVEHLSKEVRLRQILQNGSGAGRSVNMLQSNGVNMPGFDLRQGRL
jgi:hypothetical protein